MASIVKPHWQLYFDWLFYVSSLVKLEDKATTEWFCDVDGKKILGFEYFSTQVRDIWKKIAP
jgi:hypothetical protein